MLDASSMGNTFKFVHKNMDGFKIKEKVDEMGIRSYINYCAGLAAGTGAVAGLGGGLTLVVGLPADVANTIVQQFRVSLAVIYHRTGRYKVDFAEFMKIVGVSVGIEAGLVGVNILTAKIAQEILKKLTARTAARVIPVLGAVAGGGLNFLFIKSIGNGLLALEDSIFS